MKSCLLLMLSVIFFAVLPAMAQSYDLAVVHEHTLRDCRGMLTIKPETIAYRTAHTEDAREWTYVELKQIRLESATSIELVSYEDQKRMLGRDRVFRFKVLKGEITPLISALLLVQAARPLVMSIMPTSGGKPTFEIPARHSHAFGGCVGLLRVYPDRIVYESKDTSSDSRYWRYGDIQNFSQSERYRFEVTTFEDKFGGSKAYHFQLRAELPAAAYDYVWARVYPSKFARGEN